MGPLPRTANGKLYILVAIDYMTRFGTPLEIISDNGPGFRGGLLTKELLGKWWRVSQLKVSHRHSTPYYPQSNGLVEKANGIIAGIIRKMVESKPKRWDNFLDGAIWAYRTKYRDATQFTPFHLVYGQEALQPIELNIPTFKLTGRQEQNNDEAWIDRLLNLVELEWKREIAYHCYEKKALQLKDKLNEGIKDKEIKEKSLVLRYNNALDNRFDAKFERRWEGPFIVKKAFTGEYYQLMDLNGKEHPRKVNGYRLKPYLSRILPAVFEIKQVSKKTKRGCPLEVGANAGGEYLDGKELRAGNIGAIKAYHLLSPPHQEMTFRLESSLRNYVLYEVITFEINVNEGTAKQEEQPLTNIIMDSFVRFSIFCSAQDATTVDGVDCLMLGPTDLSSSIRYLHDPRHENVMKLMYRVEKAILSVPSITYLARFAMPRDPPEEMRKRGYHIITGTVDLALFRNAAVADVKANKASSHMQELVSCDGTNYGCDGGEMDLAIASKSRGVSSKQQGSCGYWSFKRLPLRHLQINK
ncbi:hypothetical protein L7F22_040224 [Adiantum nelumboides]|nr:hypothetical protein [Adiantum nelumboides]